MIADTKIQEFNSHSASDHLHVSAFTPCDGAGVTRTAQVSAAPRHSPFTLASVSFCTYRFTSVYVVCVCVVVMDRNYVTQHQMD